MQDIFDRVSKHLLTQKARSHIQYAEGFDCMYQSPDGKKCAIGCLIEDEHYNAGILEFHPVHCSWVKEAVEKSVGRTFTKDEVEIFMRLQDIHDNGPIPEWERLLEALAIEYGVNYER